MAGVKKGRRKGNFGRGALRDDICKSVIKIFWDKDFVVRNTIKNGQSWCSAVICRKRSAFDMQLHLIVVSIFLKPFVKDQGDSSSRLLERRV